MSRYDFDNTGVSIAAIVLLATAFPTYTELRYAASAERTTATLLRIREYRHASRFTEEQRVEYTYRFADSSGRERTEMDDVASPGPTRNAPTIAVEYIPGSVASRLAGTGRWHWPLLALVSVLYITVRLIGYYRIPAARRSSTSR